MSTLGITAWLLGIRTVEKDDHHVILRVPYWLRGNLPAVAQRLREDERVMGRNSRITFGDSLIRVDREAS